MTVAVPGACVLFRGTLTDFLLNLAEQGASGPAWSNAIHAEWARNLHAKLGIPEADLAYRRREMERAFPGANCPAGDDLVAEVARACAGRAEAKDAHVVATAAAAGASHIVTDNTRDFPAAPVARYGIAVLTPDDFCATLLARDAGRVVAGARAHRLSLRRPAYAPGDYLALLAGPKAGLRRTAAALAAHGTGP